MKAESRLTSEDRMIERAYELLHDIQDILMPAPFPRETIPDEAWERVAEAVKRHFEHLRAEQRERDAGIADAHCESCEIAEAEYEMPEASYGAKIATQIAKAIRDDTG